MLPGCFDQADPREEKEGIVDDPAEIPDEDGDQRWYPAALLLDDRPTQ